MFDTYTAMLMDGGRLVQTTPIGSRLLVVKMLSPVVPKLTEYQKYQGLSPRIEGKQTEWYFDAKFTYEMQLSTGNPNVRVYQQNTKEKDTTMTIETEYVYRSTNTNGTAFVEIPFRQLYYPVQKAFCELSGWKDDEPIEICSHGYRVQRGVRRTLPDREELWVRDHLAISGKPQNFPSWYTSGETRDALVTLLKSGFNTITRNGAAYYLVTVPGKTEVEWPGDVKQTDMNDCGDL